MEQQVFNMQFRFNWIKIIPSIFFIYYIITLSNFIVSDNLSALLILAISLPIFLLIAILRLDILIYLYISLIPLESLLEVGGGMDSFNLMKPLGVLLFGVWLINIFVRRDNFTGLEEVILPSMFAIMGITSAFWSYYMPDASIRIGIRILLDVALFFMLYQWLNTPQRVWNSCKAYTFGTIISAVVALYIFIEKPHERVALFGENEGIYPVTLIVGLFFLFYQIFNTKKLYHRAFYIFMFITVYMAGLASGTRSFIYSSIFLFPLSVYKLILVKDLRFNKLYKPILAILASIVIAIFSFILIQSSELTSDRFSMGFSGGNSFSERLFAIKNTYLALEYNPLLGVGLGNYPYFLHSKLGNFRDPHNIFVTPLQELGVVGFIVFVAFYGRILKRAFKLHRILSESNQYMFVPIYSFFMMSIMALSEPLLQQKHLWFILAQMVSIYVIGKTFEIWNRDAIILDMQEERSSLSHL